MIFKNCYKRNKACDCRDGGQQNRHPNVLEAFANGVQVLFFCDFAFNLFDGGFVVGDDVDSVSGAASNQAYRNDAGHDCKGDVEQVHDSARPNRRHQYGDERQQGS